MMSHAFLLLRRIAGGVVASFLFAATAHGVPLSFTFEGQLASGSEGAFEPNADYALTFLLDNGGTTVINQTFEASDFLSVVLISGVVEWQWDVTNATVPFFSDFQSNGLGELEMGNGVFLRAGLYDLATFASSPFGAASLDGNDRATSSQSVLLSMPGTIAAVSEPHSLMLWLGGLLCLGWRKRACRALS